MGTGAGEIGSQGAGEMGNRAFLEGAGAEIKIKRSREPVK